MPEIRTVTTLTTKREAIERTIAGYEAALKQARADLASVSATIAFFQRDDPEGMVTPYFDLHRLFVRGEMAKIAKLALMDEGPLSTTELADRVVKVKGFDPNDKVLRKAIAFRLVQALRLQYARGTISDAGKRKGVRVWTLPN